MEMMRRKRVALAILLVFLFLFSDAVQKVMAGGEFTVIAQTSLSGSISESGCQVTISLSESDTFQLNAAAGQVSGTGSGQGTISLSGTFSEPGATGTISPTSVQFTNTYSVTGTVDENGNASLDITQVTTTAPSTITVTATIQTDQGPVTESFPIPVSSMTQTDSFRNYTVLLQNGYQETIPFSAGGIQGQTVITVSGGTVQYTLTIQSSTGGSTSPAGTITKNAGTTLIVTATPDKASAPDNAYHFDHWILDGVDDGKEPAKTVTFDSDHVLQAVFTQWPWYYQKDYNKASDKMGHSSSTLADQGCAVTCAAMIFTYWLARSNPAKKVTPRDLNKWLSGDKYGFKGNTALVYWERMRDYANEELHLGLELDKIPKKDDAALDKYLSQNVPVSLEVGGGHWVVAYAKATIDGKQTYLISDPGHKGENKASLLDYGSTYRQMRAYYPSSGPFSSFKATNDPVQMRLTDPLGATTGFEPATNTTASQIPDSSYYLDPIPDDELGASMQTLDVVMPMNGTYKLEVFGDPFENYTVDFLVYDRIGDLRIEEVSGVATPSSIQVFLFNYSDAPGNFLQFANATTTLYSSNSTRPTAGGFSFVDYINNLLKPITQPIGNAINNTLGNYIPYSIISFLFVDQPIVLAAAILAIVSLIALAIALHRRRARMRVKKAKEVCQSWIDRECLKVKLRYQKP